MVIAGFEPLDILQAIQMILVQLRDGRCEVENQYKRVVPWEGNLRALEVMAEVFELRPHFEWRGLGFISHSGLKLSAAYADFDAEQRFSVPHVRVADPKACQCGEVLKGVIKPWECKVFGTACTPERPIGTCMVSSEGACAAYYNYGRFARHDVASTRQARILEIIETARSKPLKFRDERITMAHGAGGKATARLIEGLLAPAFGMDSLDDAALVGEIAITTDAFVVKPLRFPGGSIGELAVNGTVNDLAVAGARPLALSLSLILEEGLDAPTTLTAEVEAIAAAAARSRRPDRRRRHQGRRARARRRHVHHDDRDRATRSARALSPESLEPGDRILLSGSIGEHGTAIMLARGEFELAAAIESDTRSLWPEVDALLDAAGPHLRCMRDATRGGVASVLNELARASRVAMLVREADVPVAPAVAGASELLGIDPMYVANEGRFVAIVAPEGAEAALAAMPDGADIGEVTTEPPGMVLVETSFGGKRVMDQLVGDPLPRIC